MNSIVIGASAGLGRALSEALAARGHNLVLVAQGARDVEAQAAALRLKYRVSVVAVAVNAADVNQLIRALGNAVGGFSTINGLFFPAGYACENDCGCLGVSEVRQILDVNLTCVIATVANFLPQLLASSQGHIVGFGSIASIRGRRVNLVYAAAKSGLETYFEGLRHRCVGHGVHVQFYQLGYLATQQTYGRTLLMPSASPSRIAEFVVTNLNRDTGTTLLPRYWEIVAILIRLLPWHIYKRLTFW